IALGVDAPEIGAAFGLLFAVVDLLVFERDAGFARNDVRRKRAGAGRKIQFHDKNLQGPRLGAVSIVSMRQAYRARRLEPQRARRAAAPVRGNLNKAGAL